MLGVLLVSHAKRWLSGYLFLAPSLILIGLFWVYPIIYSLYLSLTEWDLLRPAPRFVGLMNYAELIQSPDFRLALWNTALFTVGTVGITTILALLLALLVDNKLRGMAWYRMMIFAPYVTPTVAMAIVWMWIYNPQAGLANAILNLFGLPPLGWLSSTAWALPAVAILSIWKSMGYYMMLFLAGLQSIPQELYEAASIDGGGPWTKLRFITLPLLSPMTFFIVVVGTIQSFQVFDQIAIMTQGGPANSTLVLVYYLYRHAFQLFRVGYASAVATVLFLILLALTILQFQGARRWVHYV